MSKIEEKYKGDMILINRLSKFLSDDNWQWNKGEVISFNDIAYAIHKAQPEESEPFEDQWKHFCMKTRSTKWRIGRILYFINHPEEIKDVEIDNLYSGEYIFPVPVIIDGNHRLMAAIWLASQGKMNKIHCIYGGRIDLLDYLTGKTDNCPDE